MKRLGRLRAADKGDLGESADLDGQGEADDDRGFTEQILGIYWKRISPFQAPFAAVFKEIAGYLEGLKSATMLAASSTSSPPIN